MLVWINGPFGGGKTQTAHEIRRRLAGSMICEPELLGFGLHRMMPASLRGDFQDLAAWRLGVFEVLDLTLKGSTGPVIVPMTVRGADLLSRKRSAAYATKATTCGTSRSWLSAVRRCAACVSGVSDTRLS